MKIKIFAVIAMLLSALTINARRHKRRRFEGDYAKTCKDFKLDGRFLAAKCEKSDKSWVDTTLDLSECLANIDGKFKWQQGGSYNKSAEKCHLKDTKVTCQLKNVAGKNVEAVFDLNPKVTNKEGVLTCDDLKSTVNPKIKNKRRRRY